MKRNIVFCDSQGTFSQIEGLLESGWVLDPELKVLKLENSVVYHLIKYDEGEEPKVEPEKMVETVVEVKVDSDPTVIKEWTDKGYAVQGYYSGKIQLVKYKENKP